MRLDLVSKLIYIFIYLFTCAWVCVCVCVCLCLFVISIGTVCAFVHIQLSIGAMLRPKRRETVGTRAPCVNHIGNCARKQTMTLWRKPTAADRTIPQQQQQQQQHIKGDDENENKNEKKN